MAHAAGGPSTFVGSAPASPPSPPSSPALSPPSPSTTTVINVDATTIQMEVVLQLTGSGLTPVTQDELLKITNALASAWGQFDGVDGVAVASAAAGTAPATSGRRLRAAAAPSPATALSPAASTTAAVVVQALVNVTEGLAPSAAESIAQSVLSGETDQALSDQGVPRLMWVPEVWLRRQPPLPPLLPLL